MRGPGLTGTCSVCPVELAAVCPLQPLEVVGREAVAPLGAEPELLLRFQYSAAVTKQRAQVVVRVQLACGHGGPEHGLRALHVTELLLQQQRQFDHRVVVSLREALLEQPLRLLELPASTQQVRQV